MKNVVSTNHWQFSSFSYSHLEKKYLLDTKKETYQRNTAAKLFFTTVI